GYTSFTFQVQDNGGTAHGGVDQDTTPRTMTVDVTAVNDAPVGADKALTITPGSTYTFNMADFGFSDHFDAPANVFWSVGIVAVDGVGTLSLAGVAVNAGDAVLASDIAAGKLLFTPAGGNGFSQASFTFRVMDDGGTALSGSDTDAVARRMSITVSVPTGPDLPGSANPGTGTGTGGSNSGPSAPTTPASPTVPPVDPKDDPVVEIEDPHDESGHGASPTAEEPALPPVHAGDAPGAGPDGVGAAGRGSAYSSSYGLGAPATGFAFGLGMGSFNMALSGGGNLFGTHVNLAGPSANQDLNLSFSAVGVNGSAYGPPTLAFTDTTEDRQVKVEKMVVQTSGAVLSIGAVWWAARMSGLLASLMISTPAWRSIDPLPVMGLGDGPDGDGDDEHGDDPDGMDARAAHLFGAGLNRNRELEGIG
ncbi:MAG: hypothetical protein ACREB4_20980, partial [Aquabacterium sp.]